MANGNSPRHHPFSDLKAIREDFRLYSLRNVAANYLGLTGALLLVAGLCVSAIMMSVGVILIGCQLLFPENYSYAKRALKQQPLFWLMAVYYLVPFSALLFSSNTARLLAHQQTVLPLLILPIGFLTPPLFKPRQQRLIADTLVLIACLTGALSFGHYLLHYEALNEALKHGKIIPIVTSINHIYYSIVLAVAIVVGGVRLWVQQQIHPRWKQVMWIMTGANIAFLHFFTTRTGLGGFYVALALIIFTYLLRQNRWQWAIGGVSGLAIVGLSAIYLIPPLHTQYKETVEDLKVYFQDKNPNYFSLTTRLKAWETSYYIIRQNPAMGVGAGTFSQAMDSAYEKRGTLLLPKNRMGPHNQYLETAAQAGIPGFFALIAMLFWPVYLIRRKRYSITGLGILAILAFAGIAESILERQTGATLWGFLWPWVFYQVQMGKSEPAYDDPDSP